MRPIIQALVLVSLWLVATAPPSAAADGAGLLAMQLTGHYQIRAGDSVDSAAKVYRSVSGVPRFLIDAPSVGAPWLIAAGEKKASRLDGKSVAVQPGDPDAVAVDAANVAGSVPITIEGARVVFFSDRGKVVLEPREPIIGERTPEQLLAAMPEYRRVASAFVPSKGEMRLLETLTVATDVEVFFGTWCPHCEKLVPRVMRLCQELQNPKLKFHFHGLPGKINEDPMARQYAIEAVPIMVVRQGDKILARLEGRALQNPEATISAALFGGSS